MITSFLTPAGAPLEFSQCCDGGQDKGLRWVAATNSYPGGEVNNFGLKRGQWTDDASMGLALADSLLATGGFDGADARIRWHLWWARGYANAFKYDGHDCCGAVERAADCR